MKNFLAAEIQKQSIGKLHWVELLVRFRVIRGVPAFKDKYDLVQSVHGTLNAAITAAWCLYANQKGSRCGKECNCLLSKVTDVSVRLQSDPLRKVSVPPPLFYVLPTRGIDQRQPGDSFTIRFLLIGKASHQVLEWVPVMMKFSQLWRNKSQQWTIPETIWVQYADKIERVLWKEGTNTRHLDVLPKLYLTRQDIKFKAITLNTVAPVFFDLGKQYMLRNSESGPPLSEVLRTLLIRLMQLSEAYCGGRFLPIADTVELFSDVKHIYPSTYRTNGSWRRKPRSGDKPGYTLQGMRLQYELPTKITPFTKRLLILATVFGIGNFTSFGMGRVKLR